MNEIQIGIFCALLGILGALIPGHLTEQRNFHQRLAKLWALLVFEAEEIIRMVAVQRAIIIQGLPSAGTRRSKTGSQYGHLILWFLLIPLTVALLLLLVAGGGS